MITTLEDARTALRGVSSWVLGDGKAGDEAQCFGVTERLGLVPERRVIAPRAFYALLTPYARFLPHGGIDPREAPSCAGSPTAPPFPDIVIASGRRAAPYLRAIKHASGGKTFTVFLKDPRSGCKIADFLWVPAHDRLRGPNVLTTLTSPHRILPEDLAALRHTPPPAIARLAAPRIALLIGGDSKDFRFTPADIARFVALLRIAAGHGTLMATASRRSPPALIAAVAALISQTGGWLWDGSGDNPYRALLANADALIVTSESVNMIGEAVATGQPVHHFMPSGHSRKIAQFLRGLEALGALHPFLGAIEGHTYPPIDATPAIAIELARRFSAFRSGSSP